MSAKQNPATKGVAVTPGTTTFQSNFRSLYVGTGGDIVVTMAGTDVTFANVPDGTFLPVEGSDVKSSGTTASDIVALY